MARQAPSLLSALRLVLPPIAGTGATLAPARLAAVIEATPVLQTLEQGLGAYA